MISWSPSFWGFLVFSAFGLFAFLSFLWLPLFLFVLSSLFWIFVFFFLFPLFFKKSPFIFLFYFPIFDIQRFASENFEMGV